MYKTTTVIENYMPQELHAYYERAFTEKSDKFKELFLGNAPFAFQDGETITDCTLKKISIPVFKTGKADGEGKLVFTLLVHDGSLDGLKKEANRKYEIKIDPTKHRLIAEDESVLRYVDVDLTQYGIVLAKGETLAMFTPAPERAKQLSRNDGTSPDLILMYMGINDLHNNAVFGKTPFGGLYAGIMDATPDTYESLVSACLGEALAKTDNGRRLLNEEAKPTYESFEEAYALALYIIKEKYPNAEVVCIGLQNNARAAFTVEKQQRINLIIKALAEHFGYVYADQTGDYCEINTENMHYHTMDKDATHLNYRGHAATERMILRYLADKVKNG